MFYQKFRFPFLLIKRSHKYLKISYGGFSKRGQNKKVYLLYINYKNKYVFFSHLYSNHFPRQTQKVQLSKRFPYSILDVIWDLSEKVKIDFRRVTTKMEQRVLSEFCQEINSFKKEIFSCVSKGKTIKGYQKTLEKRELANHFRFGIK